VTASDPGSVDQATGRRIGVAGRVDLEWGPVGARHLAEAADVVVVVDVLSFSTSVTMACERGARVWPHPGGEAAHELARSLEAVLAGTRSHRSGPSLSPASLVDLPDGTRLVLPSPNGSAISHALAGTSARVLVGCLRNAGAVARHIATVVREPGSDVRVAVVPAGELWADGSMRVAYEDHVGAGAVVARLAALLPGLVLSPEARVAALAFEQHAAEPHPGLADTPSARELVERGYGSDVELAGALDVSQTVPVLRDGSFTAA
jgi:2-phosphosulfolactate phosphatase